jgi:hypothetical protein
MPLIIYAIFDSINYIDSFSSYVDAISLKSKIKLEIISTSTLSAIVSRTTDEKKQACQNDVMIYATIIGDIAAKYSILPMRYGSIVSSPFDVTELLNNHNETFVTIIKKINDKEEYSLRILYSHHDKEKNNIEDLFDLPQNVPDILHGNTDSKKYLLNKYIKHLSEEKRLQYIDKIQSIVACNLQKITDLIVYNKQTTTGFIVDAVFMIERSKKSELLDLVIQMQTLFSEHNVVLSGPWPPYNFSSINIG